MQHLDTPITTAIVVAYFCFLLCRLRQRRIVRLRGSALSLTGPSIRAITITSTMNRRASESVAHRMRKDHSQALS